MRQIHHINLKDESGRIYCCLRNKVVKFDEKQRHDFCGGCSMFAGEAGGLGVECVWEDLRPVSDPHTAQDPAAEWRSNQIKHISPADHLATCIVNTT